MLPVGEKALQEAFHFYTNAVSNGGISSELWETGFFSYLLTPKQKSLVKKICDQEGWGLPTVISGMTITGSFVKHVINARTLKDKSTIYEVAEILAITFHKNGQIAVNYNHEEQGLIINSKNKVTINGNGRYAMAAFYVQKKLSPVTSYDADRAKILKKLGR